MILQLPHQRKEKARRFSQTIHAHVEVERNIKCAVERNFKTQHKGSETIRIERGELMVEFNNMKMELSNYEQPLLEMGNSL